MRPRRALRGPIVLRAVAVLAGLSLGLTACGSDAPTAAPAPADDWEAVLAQADGQSVNWYMYGGDDAINAFVEGEVSDRLAALGVTLNQVRITDTADAVNKVLGEQQAGRTSGGAVDAIWINGENFATGIQADLWRCDWAEDLPNAQYVDLESPAVATDFGVPTDGARRPGSRRTRPWSTTAPTSTRRTWSRSEPGGVVPRQPGPLHLPRAPGLHRLDGGAHLPLRHGRRLRRPSRGVRRGGLRPGSRRALAAAQRARAGPVARRRDLPAEPAGGREALRRRRDQCVLHLRPRCGRAAGRDGLFPESTREAVLAGGNISNVSFLAIPANAAHQAGALVLANVLQEPEVQLGAVPGRRVSTPRST